MLPGYKIRHLEITPGLVLAPMSGVTGSAFRRLIRELNPGKLGLVISEFISVEALTRKVNRSLDMMRYHPSEKPVGIQIFGYDLDRMRDAALMVQDSGADLLDINCGCPAPKVVRKGGGCELMRQPEHLAKILRTVRSAVTLPLTMKFRAGWDEKNRNALEVAHIAESEGVEALAVHGRTRAQMYRGEADWKLVHEIAESVKIPVLGSGDITDQSSARSRLFPDTGDTTCKAKLAGVFIGRGAISNPYIFTEIVEGTQGNWRRDKALVLQILDRYAQLLSETLIPKASVGRMKQLASQMCRGYSWRRDLCRVNTFEEQRTIIARLQDGSFCESSLEKEEGQGLFDDHSTEFQQESTNQLSV